ncbi:MAG TPA: DCC1-like thiol-disulfide oxidoreductase family protein [Kofleriaceae bacterium]
MRAPIVLYDGTCGLCSKSVRWILRHESDHALAFAPLQGETAAELRARHPEIPKTLDSVVLVDEADRVWLRSKTFLRVAKHLRAPWRIGYHVRWLPAFVLDLGYRVIARLRYRIWGRADVCDIPAPEQRGRFLP